jgi:hypothetical protein
MAVLGTTLLAAADKGTARVIGFIATLLTAGVEVYGQSVIKSRLSTFTRKESETTPTPPSNTGTVDIISSEKFKALKEQGQEGLERVVGQRRAG